MAVNVLIKRQRSLSEAIFWFNKWFPKDIVALTSQRLAAAGDMLHCFSLFLAESAGWIPTKQAHDSQMSSYRSMSSEDCNCHKRKDWLRLREPDIHHDGVVNSWQHRKND